MESTDINLLPRQEVSLGEKTLRWALTTGRVIIVVTEFIVISAFLYRFVLDRTLTDLNESIENNSIIIEESRDIEKGIRLLQTQLTEADKILNRQHPYQTLVETLAANRPSEVVFDKIDYQEGTVTVAASSIRAASPAEFFQALNQSQSFNSIAIKEIGFSTGKTKFKISAKLNWEALSKNEKL
jgi:Tfp pilus assembly protein PilN